MHVCAGNGGNGCVSFRREKFVPLGGADGGDGGGGGSVFLKADKNVDSLVPLFYAPYCRADHGVHGKGKKLRGRVGDDLVTKVPCGTEVHDAESGELLVDLVEDGSTFLVGSGGKGGLGNYHWQNTQNKAPREHTNGEPGEQRDLRLEFKTVAAIGMIGFPNAGKSSLLSKISHAHPKIAPYPFTTMHPIVGTVMCEDFFSFRTVDVAGLIEGAHKGTGLGDTFLRHVERTKILLVIIDMAAVDGRNPTDDYNCLLKEMEMYQSDFMDRPRMVVANKFDMPEAKANVSEFTEATGITPIEISAAKGTGIEAVIAEARRLVEIHVKDR